MLTPEEKRLLNERASRYRNESDNWDWGYVPNHQEPVEPETIAPPPWDSDNRTQPHAASYADLERELSEANRQVADLRAQWSDNRAKYREAEHAICTLGDVSDGINALDFMVSVLRSQDTDSELHSMARDGVYIITVILSQIAEEWREGQAAAQIPF
jgi:hypothetical protein